MSAGAPVVLATLWGVEDWATATFIEHFYAALAEGADAALALQHSQQILREDPRTAHPYYWSGFVIIGSGDEIIPLQEVGNRISRKGLLVMGLAAIALSLLNWGRRQSRRNIAN